MTKADVIVLERVQMLVIFELLKHVMLHLESMQLLIDSHEFNLLLFYLLKHV